MDGLLDRFAAIDPSKRRKAALWLLLISFVLGHINMGAFLAGWIDPELMDAITNYLSWLAITFTALDVLVTTDVRTEVER